MSALGPAVARRGSGGRRTPSRGRRATWRPSPAAPRAGPACRRPSGSPRAPRAWSSPALSAASLPKLRDSDRRADARRRAGWRRRSRRASRRCCRRRRTGFPIRRSAAIASRIGADALDERQDRLSSFFTGTTTDSSGATMPRLTSCARRSPTGGGAASAGFLRLSGHSTLPVGARLGGNGLRDLYFLTRRHGRQAGECQNGTRRLRPHGRARPAPLVVPRAAANPRSADRARRPAADGRRGSSKSAAAPATISRCSSSSATVDACELDRCARALADQAARPRGQGSASCPTSRCSSATPMT